MSRDPLRLTDYLGHILESIQKIQTYCDDVDEVGFLANPMLQDAVIRNFGMIGEASHNGAFFARRPHGLKFAQTNDSHRL